MGFRSETLPTSPPGPTLSIVVVNHNSWNDIARLVETLGSARQVLSGECELIVVDNASTEPMPSTLNSLPCGVRISLREENGGFAAGVNTGWRLAGGNWLLLLNPDVVAEPELIAHALACVAQQKRSGEAGASIIGFGLRNADGSRQPSVGAEPTLARALIEPLLPRSRRKYKAGWPRKPAAVPWVTGACMLVETCLMANLGGMDEDFFLYYEEVALCRSARRFGHVVRFDPSVEAVHLRPLQNRSMSPALRVITRHSRLLYFKKHRPAWEFWAITQLGRIEARVRLLWATLRKRRDEAQVWRLVDKVTESAQRNHRLSALEVRDMAAGASAMFEPKPKFGVRPRSPRTRSERRAMIEKS